MTNQRVINCMELAPFFFFFSFSFSSRLRIWIFFPAIFSLIATVGLALGTLNASAALHQQMLQRLMRSPMSYFDTTPLGRIINRFAKDVDTVDNILPATMRTALTCFLGVRNTGLFILTNSSTILGFFFPTFWSCMNEVSFRFYISQLFSATSSRFVRNLRVFLCLRNEKQRTRLSRLCFLIESTFCC